MLGVVKRGGVGDVIGGLGGGEMGEGVEGGVVLGGFGDIGGGVRDGEVVWGGDRLGGDMRVLLGD